MGGWGPSVFCATSPAAKHQRKCVYKHLRREQESMDRSPTFQPFEGSKQPAEQQGKKVSHLLCHKEGGIPAFNRQTVSLQINSQGRAKLGGGRSRYSKRRLQKDGVWMRGSGGASKLTTPFWRQVIGGRPDNWRDAQRPQGPHFGGKSRQR